MREIASRALSKIFPLVVFINYKKSIVQKEEALAAGNNNGIGLTVHRFYIFKEARLQLIQ